MRMMPAASCVAVVAVVLSFGLLGCSSKPGSNPPKTSAGPTRAAAKLTPRTGSAPGPHPTIATYIQDNGITETPVHRGDPGAPTINLALPPGWADAGQDTPDWAYDAIVFDGPQAQDYSSSIVAVVSKLTGNVDPQQIIDRAPGELENLNDYQPTTPGSTAMLGGFPAYRLGGTWVQDGRTKVVAQQTVVIPGNGGVYVLQLDADGLQNQRDVVSAATGIVDQQTTIKT
ncbi:MAG: LpqN/LpqT family lipoprotein [Mycobacteriaceae bacterium]|nr:LpqN/LpqT family lipoprotein [Mycobacteriaceae bacterium]MBV9638805.1 LpqN/LpqT family lipoprotein [Mycobacteriaceae bacterium]